MTAAWEPPREFDEYQLQRVLGHGAMGTVWLARDRTLDRQVAIKFMSPEQARIPALRERFLTEARAIARLDHPNVIRIFRIGELDGMPYLASEFLAGQSLDRIPRPMTVQLVEKIALGLARGLAAAHARGVLHRDVKPGNAILTQDGEIKLLDFGIAKLHAIAPSPEPAPVEQRAPTANETMLSISGVDDTQPGALSTPAPVLRSMPLGDVIDVSMDLRVADSRNPSLTRPDSLLGTPAYMAPELWLGEQASPQSDVYSVGVTLYELLAGRRPYPATSVAELAVQISSEPFEPIAVAAPAAPPRLARIIETCLQRDPRARYASATELLDAIESEANARARGAAPDGNPYRGLRVYDPEHRGVFFGRDSEITELVERLRSDPWVVIAGRSGAGKSSLARAGLVPRLLDGALEASVTEGRKWRVVMMVPGARPLAALAATVAPLLDCDERTAEIQLQHDPGRLARVLRGDPAHATVLVVDQLEELVTLAGREQRDEFIDVLAPMLLLAPGLRVIATVRSDFLGHFDAMARLRREFARALYILGPLTPENMRAAIVQPAAAHGFRFESNADVESLVTAASETQGALPLLGFALTLLWAYRDQARQVIPSDALDKIGGVAGALARHADRVIAALSPPGREAAQRILLALVTADGMRARRSEDYLLAATGAEMSPTRGAARIALDALVRGRLIATGDDDDKDRTYELAHEALLTGWTRLRLWLEEAKEELVLRERVALAAGEWDRVGRSADALWRGRQLDALDDIDRSVLPPTAREFVDSALRTARRARLRKRVAVIAAFVGLATWLVIVVLLKHEASTQGEHAQASALRAQQSLAALYLEQGRQAVLAEDPLRATAFLSRARVEGASGASLDFLVARASRLLEGQLVELVGHGERLWDAAWSPNGTRVVTASADRTARIWDPATGQTIATLEGHASNVWSARFSPDGKHIATASFDGQARIWDAATGAIEHVLGERESKLFGAEWSPDGTRLVTADHDRGTAVLWDPATGARLATLAGHTGWLAFALFDPSGERVLTGGSDHLAIVWNARTHTEIARLTGHEDVVFHAAWSPDGTRVVTGSDDNRVKLWDAATGANLVTFAGHSRHITAVAWSPDGKLVASASEDGTAAVWDAATGRTRFVVRETAPIFDLAFAPDGGRLATASTEVKLWTVPRGERLWTFEGHLDQVMRVAFDSHGDRLVTASADHGARIWDAQRRVDNATLRGHVGTVWDVRWSADDSRLLTAGDDRTAKIWNAATGELVASFDEEKSDQRREEPRFARWSPRGDWFVTRHGDAVELIDSATMKTVHGLPAGASPPHVAEPSPDGQWIAIGDDKDVRVVDASTGMPRAHMSGHTAPVTAIAWSRDGHRLATASEDKSARLWDPASGRALATLTGHTLPVLAVAFTPDGRGVLSASEDRTMRMWDAQTGAAVVSFEEDQAEIAAAAISPDGALVATAGIDSSVKVWSAATGRRLAIVGWHGGEVVAVAFSHDGRRVASASTDATARIWSVAVEPGKVDELLQLAACRSPFRVENEQVVRRPIDRTACRR